MKCLLCKQTVRGIITSRLRNDERRDVFYCKRCGLGMLQHNMTNKECGEFYKNDYRKIFKPRLNAVSEPAEIFSIYSNFQEDRMNLIKKIVRKDMRLLEIGCSAGMFLYKIKRYVKEVVGIDYDTRSAEFAAKICRCRTFDRDIDETGLETGYFDIICMFQTLEHLDDPCRFLKKIGRYLNPNGLIYLEVPNLQDVLVYGYDLPRHFNFYFHSAHSWYFTENSLLALMKRAGFKGKASFVQDYNLLNHMHWLSVDSPQDDCIPGLSSPRVPLRAALEPNKKRRLRNFFTRIDREYKDLLSELKLASNIHFIGRKQPGWSAYRIGGSSKKG